MLIRQENNEDYREVYNVVKEAFKEAEHSDGTEHELVERLRNSNSFIPELSLVAYQDGRIVGHVLFTKIHIGDNTGIALAPLAVLLKYQRQGIGTALVKEGHKIAKSLGYKISIVLGSEKYYPRFGYVPAYTLRVESPFEVPKENFMACRLSQDTEKITGKVKYAKEFM